eukprot:TRINITY_DN47284_c0_g1_i1.p1 TRINITY_DN47284_c0_g1~~TRINITY_DN47284_c0_g1_i1.p1  ORF type:complete len:492 (+),score=131.14 TRINITY_DN47284_c0_g1_i1:54-1529(+)
MATRGCRALRLLMLTGLGAALVGASESGSCFRPLHHSDQPLKEPPFPDEAVKAMQKYFFANINVNRSGMVVASPGAVPALPDSCVGGYRYHWMRDGALTMAALQRVAQAEKSENAAAARFAADATKDYVAWIQRVRSMTNVDPHTEPKWQIPSGLPYAGGWCRPQTDGPGLRASALMQYARTPGVDKLGIWNLVQFDLDWLAEGASTIGLETCDLWEETRSSDLLWNRVTMRAALVRGAALGREVGDFVAAERYAAAVAQFLVDPLEGHRNTNSSLTECLVLGASDDCSRLGKQLDGAVVLSLVHSGVFGAFADVQGVVAPTLVEVASTVETLNSLFCTIYPINQKDAHNSVPGILYGRYAADTYGGGNPWVFITAALASLLYQVAYSVASGALAPSATDVAAWAKALNSADFSGGANAFVAAGDAVLLRLKHHVLPSDDWHLYEQIDKETGQQYNAKDITWSYAEVLMALLERSKAVARVIDGKPAIVHV